MRGIDVSTHDTGGRSRIGPGDKGDEMKALRVTVLSLLVVVLLAAAGFGAGLAVRHLDDERQAAPRAVENSATHTPSSAPTTSAPAPTPTPEPEPEFRIAEGARGEQVRELQHRLFQLAWFPELTTGTYDAATVEAVTGFQAKRGLRATGVVDQRTWDRLAKMTKKPSHDQMFNILKPGPAPAGRAARAATGCATCRHASSRSPGSSVT